MAFVNGTLPASTTGHRNVNGVVIAKEPSSAPQITPPHYPAHFMKGSVIQLANGELRRVEELTTEDFIRSAEVSPDLCLDTSTVVSLKPLADHGTVMIELSIGQQNLPISVESTMEHPFFVYNRGWSSYSPLKTSQRYELRCDQLEVGDRCISLTLKNSRSAATSAMEANQKSCGNLLNAFSGSADADVSRLNRARLASDLGFH